MKTFYSELLYSTGTGMYSYGRLITYNWYSRKKTNLQILKLLLSPWLYWPKLPKTRPLKWGTTTSFETRKFRVTCFQNWSLKCQILTTSNFMVNYDTRLSNTSFDSYVMWLFGARGLRLLLHFHVMIQFLEKWSFLHKLVIRCDQMSITVPVWLVCLKINWPRLDVPLPSFDPK